MPRSGQPPYHRFADPVSRTWHATRGVAAGTEHGQLPYLGGAYGLAACGADVLGPSDSDKGLATCEGCLAAVYAERALSSVERLAEALEAARPTTHLDPPPRELDGLGARLLQATLHAHGLKTLSEAWAEFPYQALFDAEDVLRHALVLEALSKAAFTPRVGDVSWQAGGDCVVGIEPVRVDWVAEVDGRQLARDARLAVEICRRWLAQGEILEAARQVELWEAKGREAREAAAAWAARLAGLRAALPQA